jgi:uncharacterized protein
MNPRLLALDAAILPLVDVPADLGEGTDPPRPRTAVAELGALAGTEFGVWEIDPGITEDVEEDEVFVVLSGRARIDFASGEFLDLEPGAIVRLYHGERTTWTVRERLRKVYFAAVPSDPTE